MRDDHYITASAHHLSFHLHHPPFPLWLPWRKVCCYDSSTTLLIWPVEQLIIGEWYYPSPLMFRLSSGFHPNTAAPHSLFLSHPSMYLQLPGAIKFPGVLTPCQVAWSATEYKCGLRWTSPLLLLPTHIRDILTCTLTLVHLKLASILENAINVEPVCNQLIYWKTFSAGLIYHPKIG